jgi:hypothetical protein
LSFLVLLVFIDSADEVKEHSFFAGLDWQQVYLQKYTPPLIPPRGEVNAADAFDIGSFDEEDTKGIKVCWNETKQVQLCASELGSKPVNGD